MADPGPPASPLDELHRSLGAEIVRTAAGYTAPAHYGSVGAEYEVLRRSCAVADLSWLPRVEVRGDDRVRFLNGLVTCDVARPAPGHGCYGFFTEAKGRILSEAVIAVDEDRLWLDVAPGRGEEITAHLRKYIIAEPVEVRPAPERPALGVVGATAAERLAALLAGAAPPTESWAHTRGRIRGVEVQVLRHGRLGVPAWIVRVPGERAEGLFRELLAGVGGKPGAVGHTALETVRVEEGIPAFGVDVGSDNFPQETGAEEAISYTKGCYLGQEVVARIHYRGHVNRHLCGLLLEGSEVPPVGGAVRYEGQDSGRLTSAVHSPELGRPIGLALLHRRAAEIGNRVEIDGDGAAEVTALPFLDPEAA